jgi:glutathione S-transferase
VTVLHLRRRFEAPRERVFDAWTDPKLLSRWWAALAGWEASLAEVDLRPRGNYRLSMRDGTTGAVYTVMGEYVDVRRPERLAYTWTWEGEPEIMHGSERTLVEVEFIEDGDATEVVLKHSGFADARVRDLHGEGWSGCLANLEQRVFGGGEVP